MRPASPLPPAPPPVRSWYVAVVKWILEWTKVAACQERPIGILFWEVADGMTALLSRTLLPVPVAAPPPAGKTA